MNGLIRTLECLANKCGPDEVFTALMDTILQSGVYSTDALIDIVNFVDENDIREAAKDV